MQRRFFLTGATALTALFTAGPSLALTKASAQALIDQLSKDILSVINTGKTGAPLYKEFDKIFGKYAPVSAIAKKCLGPIWNSTSKSDQKAYVRAFRGYISRKYGKLFREFIGSTINVKSAKAVKSGYLVKSRVKLASGSPFAVDWQVYERNGKTQFYDLYLEGTSMIKSERIAIGIMLDKSGGKVSRLIPLLKKAG
ncbi:MAG: ABC transporter [Rhodobacteraceae bacterium]|nr:MAG: ABC transporter [Paracoccaceae bacterium]